MSSLECPPGYVLAQAPLESDYETCSCNSNNDLILQCEGRNILIEVSPNYLQIFSIFIQLIFKKVVATNISVMCVPIRYLPFVEL